MDSGDGMELVDLDSDQFIRSLEHAILEGSCYRFPGVAKWDRVVGVAICRHDAL